MRIAHVSTFPPLRCGIASFASDLIAAMPNLAHARYGLHYGQTSYEGFPAANVNSVEALVALARDISGGDANALILQHEFGIWGGLEGENIHPFLDNLTKPTLSILHTTFGPGASGQVQHNIIERVIHQSKVVVVLTEHSKRSVQDLIGRRVGRLIAIPHGIPDFPYIEPPPAWTIGSEEGSPIRLITPGFFRVDKGLERVLFAICELRNRGHPIVYTIAGEPQGQFGSQAKYRAYIEALIDDLNLASLVRIDGRYLPLPAQAASIQAAHVGIFAYQDPCQASSGTVPLVMGMGRPVLCTPFEYARAKSDEGPGVFLAAGYDTRSIVNVIEKFIQTMDYGAVSRSIYERSRTWIWPKVGKHFEKLIFDLSADGSP